MKYERVTQGKITKDNVVLVRNEHNDIIIHQDVFDMFANVYNRLSELEDKIEQGKIIIPKFSRNQEVYYIEYVMHAYPCPHCGEECYEEKVKGVAKGVICERIITDNQDGMDIVYTIQIEEKGKLKMFTKREEKEIFLTREEAEKRLLELQGDK